MANVSTLITRLENKGIDSTKWDSEAAHGTYWFRLRPPVQTTTVNGAVCAKSATSHQMRIDYIGNHMTGTVSYMEIDGHGTFTRISDLIAKAVELAS